MTDQALDWTCGDGMQIEPIKQSLDL